MHPKLSQPDAPDGEGEPNLFNRGGSIGLREEVVDGDGRCILNTVSQTLRVEKENLISLIEEEAVLRSDFYRQFSTSPSKILEDFDSMVTHGIFDQENIDLVMHMISNALQLEIKIDVF